MTQHPRHRIMREIAPWLALAGLLAVSCFFAYNVSWLLTFRATGFVAAAVAIASLLAIWRLP